MKILLDNCVDLRAKSLFREHEVQHVLELHWDSLSNGKLIAAAVLNGFEIMVTVDKNIRYQQNLSTIALSILELDVIKNRFEKLSQLSAYLPKAIEHTKRFRFVSIKNDGTLECTSERK